MLMEWCHNNVWMHACPPLCDTHNHVTCVAARAVAASTGDRHTRQCWRLLAAAGCVRAADVAFVLDGGDGCDCCGMFVRGVREEIAAAACRVVGGGGRGDAVSIRPIAGGAIGRSQNAMCVASC